MIDDRRNGFIISCVAVDRLSSLLESRWILANGSIGLLVCTKRMNMLVLGAANVMNAIIVMIFILL